MALYRQFQVQRVSGGVVAQIFIDEGTYNAVIIGGEQIEANAAKAFGAEFVAYLKKLADREVEILVGQPTKAKKEEDGGRGNP